jgi:sugar O-acyltransferase (sialic acid O-acetyltransferase NeuD family)
MKQVLYAVYGASGHGREVMPIVRQQLARQSIPDKQIVFVDDAASAPVINGHLAMSYSAFLELIADERYAVLAISNGRTRETLAARCASDGIRHWTVCADNVVLLDQVELGTGAVLSPFVTVTSNVRIGQHFHANIYASVAHDCIIGDFVTFGPGVKCNGNIVVEDHVYVGAGAVIKQGQPGKPLVIGEGAVVGMGAVVTRSVEPGATVVGNPARPMPRT